MNTLFSEPIVCGCMVDVTTDALLYGPQPSLGGKTVGAVLARYVQIAIGWVIFTPEQIFEKFEVTVDRGPDDAICCIRARSKSKAEGELF